MRNLHWWAIFGPAFVIVVVVAVLVSSARFKYRHPQAPHLEFEVSDRGVRLAESSRHALSIRWAGSSRRPTREGPRASVNTKTHRFGLMNPNQQASYDFEIRNTGTRELTIQILGTSCSCISAGLSTSRIAPGEVGYVRAEWTTSGDAFFSQGVRIRTNDPTATELNLRVEGKVRPKLMPLHAAIHVGQIEPGREHQGETYVFSSVWDNFQVEQVTSTIDGIGGRWQRVENAEILRELDAKAAYRITIHFPDTLPSGRFSGHLQIGCSLPSDEAEASNAETTLADAGRSNSESTELAGGQPSNEPLTEVSVRIAGEVLGRLGLYGQGVSPSGDIHLGVVPQGRGIQRRLVLRLRDADGIRADQIDIEVQPDLVQMQLTRQRDGLFHLDLTVPTDCPLMSYLAPNEGRLKIDVSHSRFEPVEFRLQFAVMERN